MDEEVKALKVQVQELRQFCIQLILALRNSALSGQSCDHWWEKLTSYPRVEND